MEQEQNKHCILNLTITTNSTLICSIKNNNNEEIKIKLHENQEEEILSISFDMNEIYVCSKQKTENNEPIEFIQDWMNEPNNFKTYEFFFKGKYHSAISEVLFALIINEFKKKIEKDWIIDDVFVICPSTDHQFSKRVIISLESIGLKNIEVNPFNYDYEEQGDLLITILNQHEEYLKCKQTIEKAKSRVSDDVKSFLNIDNNKIFDMDAMYEKSLNFTCKQKEQMKLYQLDNYCVFIASRYFDSIEDHINLTYVAKRFRYNMEKFHYNPIALTHKTRHFFPNIETLFQYTSSDELFENDKKIIDRKLQMYPYYLRYKDVDQLEKWTQKKCGEIIFDSDVDNWEKDTSVLNERLDGRNQVVFIIEDDRGEKFGYYLNCEISDNYVDWSCSDDKSFLFNLESNGRLPQPMKFEIKNPKQGYVRYKNKYYRFMTLGDIRLMKNIKKEQSYCRQDNEAVDYHGIENALCGRTTTDNEKHNFTPKRILVIQMKRNEIFETIKINQTVEIIDVDGNDEEIEIKEKENEINIEDYEINIQQQNEPIQIFQFNGMMNFTNIYNNYNENVAMFLNDF